MVTNEEKLKEVERLVKMMTGTMREVEKHPLVVAEIDRRRAIMMDIAEDYRMRLEAVQRIVKEAPVLIPKEWLI